MKCPRCRHDFALDSQPLTRSQAELYRFVWEFIREHRYAPSFEQIAQWFNYNSLSTVHEHLQNLKRKGWVERVYCESRSIVCLVDLAPAPESTAVPS